MMTDEFKQMMHRAMQERLENPPPPARFRQGPDGFLWFLPGSHKDRVWRRMDSYDNWTKVSEAEPEGVEIGIDTAGVIMAKACNGEPYPRPVADELNNPA